MEEAGVILYHRKGLRGGAQGLISYRSSVYVSVWQ